MLESISGRIPLRKANRIVRGITPREAAIRAFRRWLHHPCKVEVLVERELSGSRWKKEDRALFAEILYGTLRWWGRIQWILEQVVRRPRNVSPIGLSSAAVGTYQLLWLDKVPQYAAVHTAVEVARRLGGVEVAGWVNAVLRTIARKTEYWKSYLPSSHVYPDEFRLAVEFSLPEWLISRWSQRLDKESLRQFLSWTTRKPRIMLRVNTRRITRGDLLVALKESGVEGEPHPHHPHFIFIPPLGNLYYLAPLGLGLATVQDVSQGWVSEILDPQPGDRILDLCSAPGGKTTHLAELEPQAEIIATDLSSERLERVKEAKERGHYDNITIIPYEDVLNSKVKYDAVLVDAPCSGTGTIARHPDLPWRRSLEEIKRLSAIQLNLLHYAADRTCSGGVMVYSTCSVEKEENEEVIENFLYKRPEFVIEPLKEWKTSSPRGIAIPDEGITPQGAFFTWGYPFQCDGVYVVRLRKKKV